MPVLNDDCSYRRNWDYPVMDSDINAISANRPWAGRQSASVLAEFEVDHLASFVVTGPVALDQEEALRRLKIMNEVTGIWTIPCILILEVNDLVVFQKQTGEEMERFPISLIHSVVHRPNHDLTGHFHSLVMFSTVDHTSSKAVQHTAAELHIFQSVRGLANLVTEAILLAKEGQLKHGQFIESGEPSMSSSSASMPKDYPTHGSNDEEEKEVNILRGRTERRLYLLNRCFDEIERFVGRLHLAEEALKQLEKRKQQRKKREKQPGDGMLTMRSKRPPQEDFAECMKKFKLCFNLLALLQGRITEPNAPELVHLLFSPLALVVEASRDPVSMVIHLPDQVVSPLLTLRAVRLLTHCLTSKESQLWTSLGEAWTRPKEEWTSHIALYIPKFYDGYQPAFEDVEDNDDDMDDVLALSLSQSEGYSSRQMQRAAHVESSAFLPSGNGLSRVTSSPLPVAMGYQHGDRIRPYRPMSDYEREAAKAAFLREVLDRHGRLVKAIMDKVGRNNKELTVEKGEILELLDDGRNWWRLRNQLGEEGYCPYTILQMLDTGVTQVADTSSPVAVVGSPRNGRVEEAMVHRSRLSSPTSPPSPPPLPVQVRVNRKESRKKHDKKEKDRRSVPAEHAEELADELRSRLHMGPSTRVIKRPKTFNIGPHTPPQQIELWLRAKGFSESTISALSDCSGHDLFNASKTQLEAMMDRDEAQRLDSLLTVQKNISGWQTLSGRELQAILEKRKEMAEGASPPSEDRVESSPDIADNFVTND